MKKGYVSIIVQVCSATHYTEFEMHAKFIGSAHGRSMRVGMALLHRSLEVAGRVQRIRERSSAATTLGSPSVPVTSEQEHSCCRARQIRCDRRRHALPRERDAASQRGGVRARIGIAGRPHASCTPQIESNRRSGNSNKNDHLFLFL